MNEDFSTERMATVDVESNMEARFYKPDPGPLATERVASLTLKDQKRNKSLVVRLTFPKEPGRYPLITFSHGASGSKDGNVNLAYYWASHGYCVVQPTHEDSLALRTPEQRRQFRSLEEFVRKEAFTAWRSRAQDIQFLLNSLKELEAGAEGLKGKIDSERIGVGGHSFGSHTSLLIAGAKLVGASYDGLSDPRPKAFFLLSPQGPGGLLGRDSYKPITRPVLAITGSKDTSAVTSMTPESRKQAYELMAPGDKYLVWIEGAYHGFGGITGTARYTGAGPENLSHQKFVKSSSLAFWDAYLKRDAQAKTWLQSDELKRASKGEANLQWK